MYKEIHYRIKRYLFYLHVSISLAMIVNIELMQRKKYLFPVFDSFISSTISGETDAASHYSIATVPMFRMPS